MIEVDVELPGGRVLHAYDTGETARPLAVLWHAGTPNIGSPPAPLFEAAERLGVRFLGYDRPGYGGSTAVADRDVASAASDAVAVAEAFSVERFAVFGHSGGGPHALACAALLGERVLAVVAGSSLAPYDADGLDWFAGMGDDDAASLRAAAEGRAAKERYQEAHADAEPGFVPADWEALQGPWGWFGSVVGPALAQGPGALIDDDLAYTRPWGFDPADVRAPTLVLHGTDDHVVPAEHGRWLAERIPGAELRLVEGAGHISVLGEAEDALAWLAAHGHPESR